MSRHGGPKGARERLLSAAKSRFAKFGFDGATTRGIARDAGCDKKLIHELFGSKEGLYRAVLADHFRFVPDLSGDPTFRSAAPRERCRYFVERRLRAAREDPDLIRIVLRETLGGGIVREDAAGPTIRSNSLLAERIVRELQAAGELPPLDPRHLLASLDGLLFMPTLAADFLWNVLQIDATTPEFAARREAEAADLLYLGIEPRGASALGAEAAPGAAEKAGPAAEEPEDEENKTRRNVLLAAARLFAERGFHATTLQDIHDAAKAGYGSHRFWFKSKQGLYRAVLGDALAAMTRFNLDPGYLTEDARANFALVVDGLHEIARANPQAIKLLLREVLDGGEALKELVGEFLPLLFQAGARNLAAQQEAGLLRRFDPLFFQLHLGGMVLFYFAAAEYYAAVWGIDVLAPEEIERRKAEVLRLLLRGVKTED